MDDFPIGVLIVIILVIVLLVGIPALIIGMQVDYVTETISEKGIKGQRGVYMVYCESGNVYECEDSFLEGKFNSSDMYAMLKTGTTYKFKTRGIRHHFFSMYKNIVRVDAVDN